MDTTPLFSIITPTWNAREVIEPTMRSVWSQTFTDFEHIVMDGASRDGTLGYVLNFDAGRLLDGLTVVSEPDGGLYDAMNKGLDRARGRYLIFLNAGDAFAATDVLARLAAAAQDSPGVIYGQTRLVDATRQVVGMRHLTAPATLTADSFKRGMLVCHQAFVARRDLAPHYDLQYRFSADYDWCVRVLQRSPHNAYVDDDPIIDYLSEGLTTRHHRASLLERYRIMCRHYGTLPTLARHVSFIPRYLKGRLRR